MTSLPVPRDVIGRHGGAVGRLVILAAVLFQSFRSGCGCILLLDGWSPMSVAERTALADIVAVGVVLRTFKSVRSADAASTYHAEVRVTDVFKGRQLVDTVPYRPELNNATSGGYTGSSLTSDVTQSVFANSSGGPVVSVIRTVLRRLCVSTWSLYSAIIRSF